MDGHERTVHFRYPLKLDSFFPPFTSPTRIHHVKNGRQSFEIDIRVQRELGESACKDLVLV